jgi:hypothetical protein
VREEAARDDAGRTPFGINLAAGAVALVAAAFVAVLFPEGDARLVVVAVAVGWYAAMVADTKASLAVAGIGYLLFNGFLMNRLGELIWDGMTSAWHLITFAMAVGLGLGQRWIRAACTDLAFAYEVAELVDGHAAEHTRTSNVDLVQSNLVQSNEEGPSWLTCGSSF